MRWHARHLRTVASSMLATPCVRHIDSQMLYESTCLKVTCATTGQGPPGRHLRAALSQLARRQHSDAMMRTDERPLSPGAAADRSAPPPGVRACQPMPRPDRQAVPTVDSSIRCMVKTGGAGWNAACAPPAGEATASPVWVHCGRRRGVAVMRPRDGPWSCQEAGRDWAAVNCAAGVRPVVAQTLPTTPANGEEAARSKGQAPRWSESGFDGLAWPGSRSGLHVLMP